MFRGGCVGDFGQGSQFASYLAILWFPTVLPVGFVKAVHVTCTSAFDHEHRANGRRQRLRLRLRSRRWLRLREVPLPKCFELRCILFRGSQRGYATATKPEFSTAAGLVATRHSDCAWLQHSNGQTQAKRYNQSKLGADTSTSCRVLFDLPPSLLLQLPREIGELHIHLLLHVG